MYRITKSQANMSRVEFNRKAERTKYLGDHPLTGEQCTLQRDLNSNGGKTFIVNTFDALYKNIKAKGPTLNLYEDYDAKQPLCLFFDIDFKVNSSFTMEDIKRSIKNPSDTTVLSVKPNIVNLINVVTELYPSKQITSNTVHILKSIPDTTKKSYHIIFESVIFKNINNMKTFVLEAIKPRFAHLFDTTDASTGKKTNVLDPNVYRVGAFRLYNCAKYGSDRILKLLDTQQFMGGQEEIQVPVSSVEHLKKTMVSFADPVYEVIVYKSTIQRTKKVHMANEGEVYTDAEIVQRYSDILDSSRYTDRNKWLNVGYILRSLGDSYRDLFHHFSSKWASYNKADAEVAWHSFNGECRYTIAHLRQLARMDNQEEFDSIIKDIPDHDIKYSQTCRQ